MLKHILMNIRTIIRNRKFLAAALAALIILAIVGRFACFVAIPAGNGKVTRIVELAEGAPLKKFASDLEQSGLISSARLFTLYARLRGDASLLKAGAYQLSDNMSPRTMLHKLVAGEVFIRRFAVPEGYSIYQLAELLDQHGFFKKEAFLARCADRRLLSELGIDGKSVEGYLYPSTYNITPKMDEAGLIREMTGQFIRIYGARFEKRAAGARMRRSEVLTLASMIEKEARRPWERPLISSVFHNRLKQGMPLQSDPTAIYGVRAFGGKVSKRDIMKNSPYNTYHIKGLPPGPIGNPSAEAIEAALNPAKTGYLYFVAKNDGTHFFSATLEEHNRGVNRYLKSGRAPTSRPNTEYSNDRPHLTGRR